MDLSDFFTDDQLEQLPSGIPGFIAFVRRAQDVLRELTQDKGGNEYEDQIVVDTQFTFVNIVMAAAREYQIEPFASQSAPTISDFDGRTYRQFAGALDFLVTQLKLDNISRARRSTVYIPTKSRERIQSHIHALRNLLNRENLDSKRRADLLSRLADFEGELEKRRINPLAVGLLLMELLALPGGDFQTGQMGVKLITNVMQEIGVAKADQDERTVIAGPTPVAKITDAKNEAAKKPPRAPSTRPAFQSGSIDDDIPF